MSEFMSEGKLLYIYSLHSFVLI